VIAYLIETDFYLNCSFQIAKKLSENATLHIAFCNLFISAIGIVHTLTVPFFKQWARDEKQISSFFDFLLAPLCEIERWRHHDMIFPPIIN
jgi:hypothetical protein